MNRPGLLFVSRRNATLRLLQGVAAAPVAIVAFLLLRMPAEEWAKLGVAGGIAFGAGLTGLTLILPAAFVLLHDRYVLELVREPDGSLTLVTWLIAGKRRRRLPADTLAGETIRHDGTHIRGGSAPWNELVLPDGRRLIFDDAGDKA